MFGTKSLYEEHDCNVVSMNSLNIHDTNDMQSHKLGEAMFDEDDNFSLPSFDMQISNDDIMPPTYDDYIDESGFGRVSTLYYTYSENVQSYEIFDKSGFGEVMTLVNVNPTMLEECQLCIHVDRVKNMFCDSYIVEFSYDPTCNYYERGKYGCRNFHVTKLPLFMLRLLLFLPSSLHMLVFACLDNLFSYKMPMHRKYVRLKCDFHKIYDALFFLQHLSFR